jgi:hypothetical protein
MGAKQSAVDKAKLALDQVSASVAAMEKTYPALRAAPAADSSASALPPSRVFNSEDDARAAGFKSGDVVLMINPSNGKPARARLH